MNLQNVRSFINGPDQIMRLKHLLLSFLFLCMIIGSSLKTYATHVYGGELLYKYLYGNTYILTLTLYGDCSANAFIFGRLASSHPEITIYNHGVLYTKVRLDTTYLPQGVEVSPVCKSELGNTTCNNGRYPGVKRFAYIDTVELPETSNDWRFVFNGLLDTVGNAAGRSNQISNIYNPGSSLSQMEAWLNNADGPNSSPRYTTIPTPFYCLGTEEQYNQGAIDDDGDSLSFALVSAKDGNSNAPVAYIAPYKAKEPIATDSGYFEFNNINGQLVFTPNTVQNCLVVNQVNEYRNGVLIGTSLREMTFLVSSDCDGNKPTMKIANLYGGGVTGKSTINICEGTPFLSFVINVDNTGEDTTTLTPTLVPAGAELIVKNNVTPEPRIEFKWKTDTLPIGSYTFYVYLKNEHCPIINRQTRAYTINVTSFPTIAATVVSPTNCVHKSAVQYKLTKGYLPRWVYVKSGPNTILTYKDTTGTVRDSLDAGHYTITVGPDAFCQVSIGLDVNDTGKLPLAPISKYYCKNEPAAPIVVPKWGPDAIVTWYDLQNHEITGPQIPTTNVAGTYKWQVSEFYKVCHSDKVLVTATVYPQPEPKILNQSANICKGDTVFLEASGGIQFTWSPTGRIYSRPDGKLFAKMYTKETFVVTAVNEYGCIDSAKVAYNDILDCCKFSYPNAFTPNGDGRNDGFRVVTYGNMWDYRLAIYNRWGQMVYLTYNQQDYWDGTQNGIPCDAGTYVYLFSGRCLNGTRDEHQGDITLIR